MNNLKIIGLLTIVLGLSAGLPSTANAQAGAIKAARPLLKSKAAIAFGEILAGYFVGKGLDSIYASATEPDPVELDKALREIQAKNPEYTMMLGTLRRAVSIENRPATREEFEKIAQDLVFQMDHSVLNSTAQPAQSLQWNPSASSLLLQEHGLGLNRLNTESISSQLFADPLSDPLGLGRRFPPTLSPLLSQPMDQNLALKIVGAWSFSHRDNPEGSGADVYIFHRDGTITEYKVLGGEEILSFNGTYTVVGTKLNIEWKLTNELTNSLSATLVEIDGGHLKYTAYKGPFDLEEPVAKILTRVSDVGHFSVVTIHNPTESDLTFRIRWATIEGFWTEWEPIRFEPGSVWSIPKTGGFFCQTTFFSSLREQSQETTYGLPFSVVASRSDPKVLTENKYKISVDVGEGKVGLFSEPKEPNPTPGVR